MFQDVPSRFDFPKTEQETLAFWDKHQVYEESLRLRKGCKPFVFYEGPPTANGLPHPGHCLTRAIKDLFPRYKTMTGHYCHRKGGWDTHGLPVEVEVCKELGIHSKEEIEAYGVEPFNRKCLESVFRYTKQWEDLTRRLGFWVNLEEAYVTYHQSYVESVWWSLKKLFDADLLYKGHKIVWWWAQGGTALSAGEVGQGYREVDDPSVFVRFPIVMDDCAKERGVEAGTSLLVWTTTPWTLPSNAHVAVDAEIEYATVLDTRTSERLIIATKLIEPIRKKLKADTWKIEKTYKGNELWHLRYLPPFDIYYKEHGERTAPTVTGGKAHIAWTVLQAGYVTTDAGTGLVHIAPAFGEDDFELWLWSNKHFTNKEAIPLLNAVAPNGTFTEALPDYKGRWVKDCDKDICRDLKDRGLLLYQEQYRHDYPFCWRAEEDPLIQYPRKSWFIRTTQFKDDMLANNQAINWLPDHIKTGRFGKFLESNVDWSLSRERYWGTPLPIWECEACQHREAIDSYDALLDMPSVEGLEVWDAAKRQSPDLSDHLKVHKPYIDAITFDCPKCSADQSRDRKGAVGSHTAKPSQEQETAARMHRVPEVIDCWYDSGAMPFAQWGFPHQNRDAFESQFPAQFISEALDQTRGWFYGLTAIATMLFGAKGVARGDGAVAEYPIPFRNCIVLGLLMGEDGLKMSKSKKNYKDPGYIFEKEGADAMRWLFFSGQTPWTSIRFQEAAIAEGQREFLIRLYNCYSFFVIYANIDKWTPEQSRDRKGAGQRASSAPSTSPNQLDRWIRSELAQCCRRVFDCMEAYDNYNAARALSDFVDALSNWYVRRNRDRFWRSETDDDKRSAYATLHHCLVTVTKLIAPFTPFIAESMYQNLVKAHDVDAPLSVHLCDYPITEENQAEVDAQIDAALNDEVKLIRQLVSCGRAARSAAKLRVRQPLAAIELYHKQADVVRKYEDIIKDELNVKRIDHVSRSEIDKCVEYEFKPDFKKIGPKYGPLAPRIKAALEDPDNIESAMESLERGAEYHTAGGEVQPSFAISVDGQSVRLDHDELIMELHAKEGYAAERIPGQGIVVLDATITPELRAEGCARDLVNQVQQIRKKLDLRYEQRIDLAIVGDKEIQRMVNAFTEYIRGETLAQTLLNQSIAGAEQAQARIEDHTADIYVKPIESQVS